MNLWKRSERVMLTLEHGRFSLRLMQTRSNHIRSPWFVEILGMGSDAVTKQPPKKELPFDLDEAQAVAEASRWAEPLVVAFAREYADAATMLEDRR